VSLVRAAAASGAARGGAAAAVYACTSEASEARVVAIRVAGAPAAAAGCADAIGVAGHGNADESTRRSGMGRRTICIQIAALRADVSRRAISELVKARNNAKGGRTAVRILVAGAPGRAGARNAIAAIPTIARAGPPARRHAASRIGAATTIIVPTDIT